MDVLKWAWVHHALDATIHDSLDDALEAAVYAADCGDESLDCIELFEPEHRIISSDEAWKLAKPIEQRRDDEYAAQRDAVTHAVRLASPDGKESTYFASATSEAEAIAKAEDIAAKYGAGRASVYLCGTHISRPPIATR